MSSSANPPPANGDPVVIEYVPAPRKPVSRVRRIGCGIVLIFWFLLLLLPCGLILLATQGELTLRYGGTPGQEIRLWLIMGADERGLGISTGSVHSASENAVCVQTDMRFLLWQGQSEPLSYCECFERANSQSDWQGVSVDSAACVAS